jgi:hypothetical protein
MEANHDGVRELRPSPLDEESQRAPHRQRDRPLIVAVDQQSRHREEEDHRVDEPLIHFERRVSSHDDE